MPSCLRSLLVPASAIASTWRRLTADARGRAHVATAGRRRQASLPCRCGRHHHPEDARLGSPTDRDAYDYVGTVLWEAHAGQLWHRLSSRSGVRSRRTSAWWARCLRDVARLSYANVAEYQRRVKRQTLYWRNHDCRFGHTHVLQTYHLFQASMGPAFTYSRIWLSARRRFF